MGSVIVIEKEALKQEMEKRAGQRQKQGVSIGYCSCGAMYPPQNSHGGNRETRQQHQRVNRGHLRDNRLASWVLAKSLNPIEGGSDSRILEAIGKLQTLQQFSVSSDEEGKQQNQATEAKFIYVGMQTQMCRIEDLKEKEKNDKKGQFTAEGSQLNKNMMKIEDGLLLVVPTRICGRSFKALINSGATRCFVTPSCVAKAGLKGIRVMCSWS